MMPINHVPTHDITERLNAQTEALVRDFPQRAAGAGDDILDKLGVVIELFSETHAASCQAIAALETEVLALRVMLDKRGVLDFDDRDA